MLRCVVIGIDRYRDPRIPTLRSAAADAEAMSRLFRSIRPDEQSITTLVNDQATKSAILMAVGERLPREADADDLVTIFFAGHGCPEQMSPPDLVSRYLVPHDADFDHVFTTGIGLDTEINSILERQRARRILMLIDACFSGQAGGRTFCGPRLNDRLARFRATISLRNLRLGFGRALLAACGDSELARERADHGIFTSSLLRTLCTDGPPTIGVGELYDAIYATVTEETDQSQHPVLKGHIEGMRLPRFGANAFGVVKHRRGKES